MTGRPFAWYPSLKTQSVLPRGSPRGSMQNSLKEREQERRRG
jgi:hypothetical protein